MSIKTTPHFIIIDDDSSNNAFCEMLLKSSMMAFYVSVQCFTHPEEALKYILDNYDEKVNYFTVLLLDIDMISMTAWDFIEKFNKLNLQVKKCFKIYILSSSVDSADKHRALENESVTDYISKPLTIKVVNRILGQL